MLFRLTNNGKSPRGIHDERGSIVTIQPGETREVRLGEGAAQRYRAKIAGGDTLEMVEPLGSGAPAPKKVVPAPAPAPAEKPKADKPAADPKPSEALSADKALADLRAEAVKLGLPAADVAKWRTKRLTREIEAIKQGK